MREKFPERNSRGEWKSRDGVTIHFVIHAPHEDDIKAGMEIPRIVEVDGYLTINCRENGRPGELFIRIGKAGGSMAVFDGWCTLFSLLLQHGMSVDDLCKKLGFKQYWPFGGVTGVAGISRCLSLEDLICKIMMQKFGRAPEVQS